MTLKPDCAAGRQGGSQETIERGVRTGLEKTLSTFKLMNTVTDTWSTAKAPDDIRRGLKRKRNGDGVDLAGSFNPKYLTSRELFDLEVYHQFLSLCLGYMLMLYRSMTSPSAAMFSSRR